MPIFYAEGNDHENVTPRTADAGSAVACMRHDHHDQDHLDGSLGRWVRTHRSGRRGDERARHNASAALTHLALTWGADDPRTADLTAKLARGYGRLCPLGQACLLCGIAYVKWRANEIAMRHGRALPGTVAIPVLSVALLAAGAAIAALQFIRA